MKIKWCKVKDIVDAVVLADKNKQKWVVLIDKLMQVNAYEVVRGKMKLIKEED